MAEELDKTPIKQNLQDSIENTILLKLKNYFNLHKQLKYEKLNDFLDSVDLGFVFVGDDEKEFIWSIFMSLSNGTNEIDYNICKEGITELLRSNIEKESPSKGIVGTSPKQSHMLGEFRESFHDKEKFDELLSRISLRNSNEKIPHYNTPFIDNEEENGKKQEKEFDGINESIRRKMPKHERKITMMFTEIDINKLQQLRKAFSLLDLRNKEFIYISELQEVIRKYKFIKLSQDELINFLSLISDDLIQASKNSNNVQKLSINFELYSRAISAIEHQILKVNSDLFVEEQNDSYEIKNNYEEMIEDLNRIESENIDYIMVLADLIKSLEYNVFESIVDNYNKLIQKNFQGYDTEYQLNLSIKEGVDYFRSKIKDMTIFVKEMNESNMLKQNKLEYLKTAVNRLETNFKNSEEDYCLLFQTMNDNRQPDLGDEIGKLLEETIFLQEQKELKETRIADLEKEIDRKCEYIFNLENENSKSKSNENETKTKYNIMKKDYDNLKKNYDTLLNDIYEKIIKEEENSNNEMNGNSIINSSSKKNSQDGMNKNEPYRETIEKLREKIVINEETKKIFDMNYEQLIIYTLNTETLNKQLEEKNSENEKKIKKLEEEINEIKRIITENVNSNYVLKSENSKLLHKINDMNKELQFNQSFRPSNVLGGRMSKLDTDRKSNISEFQIGLVNNRFKKMEMLFENKVAVAGDKKKEITRISELNFGDLNNNLKSNRMNKLMQIDDESNNNEFNLQLEENVEEDIHIGEMLNHDKNLNKHNINSFDIISNTQERQNFNRNKHNNTSENNDKKTSTNKSPNIDLTFNPNVSKKSFVTVTNPCSIYETSITNTGAIFSEKDSNSLNDPQLDETKFNKTISEEYFQDESYINNNDKKQMNNNLLVLSKLKLSPGNDMKIFEEGNCENLGDEKYSVRVEKEINVDILEENPFSMKDYEVTETPDENGHDADPVIAISVNSSPFQTDKKENFKKIKENKLIFSINNTNIKNPNRKIPSQITEEILEEDVNGEFGSSITSSIIPQQVNRNSSTFNDNIKNKNHHLRSDTIEDIGLVFNKDSQYMCYDFLTLRKTEAIINMFEENNEDVSSYEMFSDNIYLMDESNYIYILRPYDLSVKTRIPLKILDKLTISNKNCNLIAFHFKEGDDHLFEILRRMELLYFFRDLNNMKTRGPLRFKYADNFKIKRNNIYSNIVVDQANNFFIAPNFDGAQKLGYLSKLTGTFFSKFKEKLVVLTNVGLLYFDDPNRPPKKLIPIIGSEILEIKESKYRKKHCFEIKTLNGESYVFACNSKDDLESWQTEFNKFKKNYENKFKAIETNKK